MKQDLTRGTASDYRRRYQAVVEHMKLKFLLTDCFQQKRKLRIFISNTFNPAKPDAEDGEGTVASWELRVEGRLLEDVSFMFEICIGLIFLSMNAFCQFS